jgi:hypothetical protein
VGGNLLQQCAETGADLVGPGPVFAVEGFLDHIDRALDRGVHQGEEGLLLVGIVLVEGRVADLRPAYDLLDRGVRVALLGNEVGRCFEDSPSLIVRGLGPAHGLEAAGCREAFPRQCTHRVRIAARSHWYEVSI